MKRILILLLLAVLLTGCAGTQKTTAPPTQTTTSPITSHETGLVHQSLETTTPSDEPDIPENALGISYLAEGYRAKQVLPSAFGLPAQVCLLPNGDIAFSSYSESIHLLSGGTVHTLVATSGVMTGITALPDGRICYCIENQLYAIHPESGAKEKIGTIPTGEGASALGTDNVGAIYAATHNKNLYRFKGDNSRAEKIASLPYEYSPTDIEITESGDIYITGPICFVTVNADGRVTVLADDLLNEPAWCEIAPDNRIYVKDICGGLRTYDPETGLFSSVELKTSPGVSDFIMISPDEMIFFPEGSDIIISYNLKDGTGVPIAVNPVNSAVMAAANDGSLYYASPGLPGVTKSHFIHITSEGVINDLSEIAFDNIWSADMDFQGRLCFYADGEFHRFETDGSLTSISPAFPPGKEPLGKTSIAIGPDGLWYCLTYNSADYIQVWTVDDDGNVNFLPLRFGLDFFDNAYELTDSRIDVGEDGNLALVLSAVGSSGQGPCYQRVYRCGPDGNDFTLVGNFDSSRIGGMFDIGIGPDNEIIVLTCQKDGSRFYEVIYRIDDNSEITDFLEMSAGRDPKGIDVDSKGNVWISSTVGLYYISHQD